MTRTRCLLTRTEIGPDAKPEALVAVRQQYAAWDAYRGSAAGHGSPAPALAEPMTVAAAPPAAEPAVTEAAILNPGLAVAPSPPASLPDSRSAAWPVSSMLIVWPAGVVLAMFGAVVLVRRRRAARDVAGGLARADGVQETESLIARNAATEMPPGGSDDAAVASVVAARSRPVDDTAGPPSEAVRRALLAWADEDRD